MSNPRNYTSRDFARTGPATARRYTNLQTGDVVSRRRYQQLIGKPLPKHVASPKHGKGPSKLWKVNMRRWATDHGMTRQQAKSDATFRMTWQHLRAIWRAEQSGQVVDRSPGGDYALTLEELGMRAPQAPYWVGDTP